jgi:hypothetical protein
MGFNGGLLKYYKWATNDSNPGDSSFQSISSVPWNSFQLVDIT